MKLTRADIRLGNWVKVDNIVCQVGVRFWQKERNMEAIDLSKYIFQDLGFVRKFRGEKGEDPYYFNSKHGLTFACGRDGLYYLESGGVVLPWGIRYAHQVQNVIYVVLGVELEPITWVDL